MGEICPGTDGVENKWKKQWKKFGNKKKGVTFAGGNGTLAH